MSSINGFPALQFDGTDYLSGASALAASLANAALFTVYSIGQIPSLAGSAKAAWTFSDTTVNNRFIYPNVAATTGAESIRWQDSAFNGTAGATFDTNVYDHVLVADANVSTFLNGVAGAANANVRTGNNPTALNALTIGALVQSGGPAGQFVGLVGRVLIYSGAHDAAQRLATRTWLRARFGL